MNDKQKEILQQDKITKAVNKCNELLNGFGLSVFQLDYIDDTNFDNHHKKQRAYNGKIVFNETYDKLKDNE
jgi:hypothetical protein